jgi:parallel beta-helix repeat protein
MKIFLSPLFCLAAIVSLQATIYQIDTNTTLAQVSSRTYQPGDEILFRSGGSWTGSLKLKGSGTSGAPIKVGRYGDGPKPLLQGGGQVINTVELLDVSYWEISDLEITNAGDPANFHNGLEVTYTESSQAPPRQRHIYVRNLNIHDVDTPSNSGGGGIRMDAILSDVLIDGCVITKIGGNGIDVHSDWGWVVPKVQSEWDKVADEDITIQNCTVSFCGDSGIWIWGAKRPIIQDNIVHNANLDPASGFYVGIWIMHTEDGLIQHNDSSRHRKSWDGQCIDVDVLCFRTIVQYNYVHDNDYIGIIVYGYTENGQPLPTDDVIVRYNIAENCLEGSFALAGDRLTNTRWHNNTSYSPGEEQITGVPYNGTVGGNHWFENNIFYGGAIELHRFGNATIDFTKNVYFGNVGSLPSDEGAIVADPKLSAPGTGVNGYKLLAGSPCIDAGVATSGSPDYFGNPAPIGVRDVGIHEFSLATSVPAPPQNLRVVP